MNYYERNEIFGYGYLPSPSDNDPPIEYELVTDSSSTVLTVSEILEHLKVDQDHAEGNVYIELIAKAVEEIAEDFTRRTFLNKTYKTYRENFNSFIELRRSKVQSITSIKYWDDQTSAWVTIDSDVYYVTSSKNYARIYLAENKSWPSITTTRKQRIEITFVAGYGSSASSVPKDLKLAMLNHIAVAYAQRGDWGSADLAMQELIGCMPTITRLIYANNRITNNFSVSR